MRPELPREVTRRSSVGGRDCHLISSLGSALIIQSANSFFVQLTVLLSHSPDAWNSATCNPALTSKAVRTHHSSSFDCINKSNWCVASLGIEMQQNRFGQCGQEHD
jgi:hypothetical protein